MLYVDLAGAVILVVGVAVKLFLNRREQRSREEWLQDFRQRWNR